MAIALAAASSVQARTHHRAAKPSTTAVAATPAVTATSANIPTEQNRDPADVALDRKIKGICRGC
jgi:hypothetical protein